MLAALPGRGGGITSSAGSSASARRRCTACWACWPSGICST